MGIRAFLAAGALVAGGLTGTVIGPGAADADSCESASAADFNGDGHDDIVIGDYRANVADEVAAGAVAVNYGDDELGDGSWLTLTEDSPGVASGPSRETGAAAGDGFGWAIATAHIDADGCLDLLVGAPWRDDGGQRPDAGAVHLVFGSPDGLGRGRPGHLLRAADWSSSGNGAQAGQLFGWSVGAADARLADRSAVAIGAPYDDRPAKNRSGTVRDAGAVRIAWFTGAGAPAARKTFGQDAPQFPGSPEVGDLFGWAVALGATGGQDALRDLIVTEPYEDVSGEGADVGSVTVLNDISGPAGRITNEHWHYGNIDLPAVDRGLIGYSLAYAEDGKTRYVAAGIPGQTVAGRKRAGAVKMFTSTGAGLKPAGLYTARDGRADDRFGFSVALGGPAVTGAGTQLAAGAPYANGQRGYAHLVPVGQPAQGTRIEPAGYGGAGVPGNGARFGWSVAFAGDRAEEGALLIGVPDDREKVTGSITIHPFGDTQRRLIPDGIGFPSADLTDFGNSLS
jgi:hypothetical protein